ncbi:hypothetical protein EDB80DRAFT_724551 [Ilyonectria destructans]|nr:hypothetical protein EDB80DRAFT_724551 [Ilyonectria destructans]
MSDPHSYTIGWICAITTERVAAQAFLDEEHEGPREVAQNDNNSYALGRIGKHNIVIAVLPKSEYGITSAATVARDMLHSFPNIRIGLMVGIAGGAPSSKHDIRLGDIVVSCRDGGKGGVIPYDYGKAIQDQTFVETGVLNQPPQLLSTAVSALEARYQKDGHQLNDAVEVALKNIKRRKKYCRPSATTDKLYLSTFIHPQGSSEDCREACGDDPLNLVAREERDEDDDNPAIHHGLIASTNTLMKDAVARDKLAVERDILCFEMEAAGLMNHFPCLVIRGIYDYSDTHKNKDWQGFAAMMAAAYAKDLLGQISPRKVEDATRMEEVLGSINKNVESVKKKTRNVHKILTQNQRHEIYNWLERTDPSPIHIRNHKLYEPETGAWMKRSALWNNWLAGKPRCLWLRGIPGAGKTVLMSQLIEETKAHCKKSKDKTVTWVYYYFYHGHRQDETAAFLRWIISQLCRRSSFVPDGVQVMYQMGTQPSLTELLSALESVLHCFSRVHILLDALDESSTPRDDLLGVLRVLVTDPRFKKTQIIASSREYVDIEKVMEEFSIPIPMDNDLVEKDIRIYVRSRICSNARFQRWPQGLLAEVEDALVTGARGMFRWTVCQIQTIHKLRPDYGIVRNELATLPKTLDETYEQVLLAINEEERQFVTYILHWIYFHQTVWGNSITSLILLQAADLSTSNAKNHFQKYDYDDDALRELCGCLITVTHLESGLEGGTLWTSEVTFAHYTVLEYLDSQRITTGPAMMFALCRNMVDHDLVRIVLSKAQTYSPLLSRRFLEIDVRRLLSEDIRTWCMGTILLLLSSEIWQRKIACSAQLRELAFELLRPSRPGYSNFCELLRHLSYDEMFIVTPIDIDIYHQFFDVQWQLVDGCEEAAILLNILHFHQFPLAEALLRRNENSDILLCRLSLRVGIDLRDSHNGDWQVTKDEFDLNGTIVEVVAQLGWHHLNALSFLLDYGAGSFDPSGILHLCSGMWSSFITNSRDNTPANIQGPWPDENGVLRRLLCLEADPNLTGHRLTPLQVAAAWSDDAKVKILLEHGADPKKVGSEDGISWSDGSVMDRCNQGVLHLYDVEPLEIGRRFQGRPWWDSDYDGSRAIIVKVLLGDSRSDDEASIEKIYDAKDLK